MFCDYFLYLFYLGCYELRIDLLKQNLALLFMIDEIRRILLEAVVPWFLNWQSKRQKRTDLKKKSKDYKQTLEYVE